MLELNSSYLFFTKKNTVFGKKARIVSILSFGEVGKVPYDVRVLFNNERGATLDETPIDEILAGYNFYHCKVLDSTEEFLVWDEVIDFARTTKINASYTYDLVLTIKNTMNVPIANIIQDASVYLNTKYSTSLEAAFIDKGINPTISELEALRDKVTHYEAILQGLDKLSLVLPMIDRVSKTDFNKIVSTINEQITVINSNISTIRANLG